MELDNLGKRLKNARLAINKSQTKIAEEAEITTAQLSNYENGNAVPGLVTLGKLSEKLGVTLDWLCKGNETDRLTDNKQSKGQIIANCFAKLNELSVIDMLTLYSPDNYNKYEAGDYLIIYSLKGNLLDFKHTLDDIVKHKSTYRNVDTVYQEQIESMGRRIDDFFEESKVKYTTVVPYVKKK